MNEGALMDKADRYAHTVYRVTKRFPKEELFGITTQLRRAALSVPLNITEGFARQQRITFRQFLRISYASLKESFYLLAFSLREGYLSEQAYNDTMTVGDEVGKMLWAAIRTLSKTV